MSYGPELLASASALALALVAALLALAAWVRASRLFRRVRRALAGTGADAPDLIAVLDRLATRLADCEAAIAELGAGQEVLRTDVGRRLRAPGVVRFDAFEGIGGALSYAVAFVDANGDGVVLSAIQGREATRVYAKPLSAWRSPQPLSPEEQAALKAAGLASTREK
ncbi:MAG: DUF4446 family protein [Clostridia bacterium]|nr:DUF4446 family protein [Clostridia bacterium]